MADEALRAEVARLRAEMQRVRTELMRNEDHRKSLGGVRGWMARITGAYEAQVAEAEATYAVLREELSIYQAALADALDRLGENPAKPLAVPEPTDAAPPLVIRDESHAAALLTDAEGLIDALEDLERIADDTVAARAALPPLRSGRHAPSLTQQRAERGAAMLLATGGWDMAATRAGRHAPALGLALSLPRQRMVGQDGVGWVAGDEDDFIAGVESSGSGMRAALRVARALRAKILAEFPNARSVQGVRVGPGSRRSFVDGWRQLLEVAERLDRLEAQRVSVADLVAPLGQWQQTAKDVRALGEAAGFEPLPPLNDGPDVRGFIGGLRAARPAWASSIAELGAAVAAEEAAADAAERNDPEARASAERAFREQWSKLLEAGERLTSAGDALVGLLGPLKAWQDAAAAVRALAERYGFEPVPPLHDPGSDVRTFVVEVRNALPAWRRQLSG